ncbi:MAG: trigger factor [Spirochaetaceae bacterium]|nr:trigger factor [Spirochaetaceae bacterium]
MNFTKEITKLEKSAVKLTFTVKNEDVREFYKKSLCEIAKEIQIKGFRKGKVPVNIIEQKFKNVLREQITNDMIREATLQTIEAEDLPQDIKPISDPQVEGSPTLDVETDFVFSVTYDVQPLVSVEKYEGFEVTADEAELTEDDLLRELEAVRERNAIVLDKESDAQIENGDVITIDYRELGEDGKADGDKREDFTFTVGSGLNLYKFDDELKGLKQNEEKTIEKTYPADFENQELAGKTKKIWVKIKSVKEKKLPDLDDDLAQDVSDKFKTLQDLKDSIKKTLSAKLSAELRRKKVDALLEKICEANKFEIPETMIRNEIYNRLRNAYAMMGQNDEKIAKIAFSDNQLVENMRGEVYKSVQTALILNKLKEVFALSLNDSDIEKEFEELSETLRMEAKEIKEYYQTKDAMDSFKEMTLLKRVEDVLLGKNTIKQGKKLNYLDIIPGNG